MCRHGDSTNLQHMLYTSNMHDTMQTEEQHQSMAMFQVCTGSKQFEGKVMYRSQLSWLELATTADASGRHECTHDLEQVLRDGLVTSCPELQVLAPSLLEYSLVELSLCSCEWDCSSMTCLTLWLACLLFALVKTGLRHKLRETGCQRPH